MPTYSDSNGKRYTTPQVDAKIRKAKMQKLENFLFLYGYVFCEDCKRNDCIPVDQSHNISVAECKKSGQVELSWDVNNLTFRGRPCHRKHDKS